MPWLDIGRLMAALAVALAHLSLVFGLGWNDAWATVALSWFFVLSGFIMAHAHPDCRPTRTLLLDFWLRRAIRIVPAYWLVLALAAAWLGWGVAQQGVAWLHTVGRPAFLSADIATQEYLSTWPARLASHALFLGALDQASSGRYLFAPPLWSLYSEMFFYLLFPFLMPLVARTRPSWGLALAFALWLAQGGVVALAIGGLPSHDFVAAQASVYSNPLVRVAEFMVGIFARHWLDSTGETGRRVLRSPMSVAMSLAAVVGVVLIAPTIPTPFNLYWIAVPVLVWNILALSQSALANVKLAAVAGGVSYLIYLLHWTVWEIGHAAGLGSGSPGALAGLLAAMLGLSVLLWWAADAPLRGVLVGWARGRGWLRRGGRPAEVAQ